MLVCVSIALYIGNNTFKPVILYYELQRLSGGMVERAPNSQSNGDCLIPSTAVTIVWMNEYLFVNVFSLRFNLKVEEYFQGKSRTRSVEQFCQGVKCIAL